MSQTRLSQYLNQINQVFDIEKILREEISEQKTIDYYAQSEYGYRIFHSPEGCVHMALNDNRVFDENGYYGQPKIVNQQIEELNAKSVLELGCGKGFNSIFLAQRNPDIKFIGIDLTPSHVTIAKRKAKGINNIEFKQGNFQKLEFENKSLDLIFAVDSICHANKLRLALAEVQRVLKPGGRFIVFDGFRKKSFENLEMDLQTAVRLVEVSMLVKAFPHLDNWLEKVHQAGFGLLKLEDLSLKIMPNLLKLQQLARKYFKSTLTAKAISRVMPPYLVKNSIAGLLMPITVGDGAQGYYLISLENRS